MCFNVCHKVFVIVECNLILLTGVVCFVRKWVCRILWFLSYLWFVKCVCMCVWVYVCMCVVSFSRHTDVKYYCHWQVFIKLQCILLCFVIFVLCNVCWGCNRWHIGLVIALHALRDRIVMLNMYTFQYRFFYIFDAFIVKQIAVLLFFHVLVFIVVVCYVFSLCICWACSIF